VVEANREFKVVARCGDGASCLEAIRILLPDIANLGMPMPEMSGPEILAVANSEKLPTRLILFTASLDDSDRQIMAAAGAQAVISDDVNPDTLVQILRDVRDNQLWAPLAPLEEIVPVQRIPVAEKLVTALTDRERQIVQLVSEGLSNKEIGRRLNLTDGTIKVHLHRIFQKLELGNRTALAALALSQKEDANYSAD
jgi:two-component system nitrate/nitrite response regulator NarL